MSGKKEVAWDSIEFHYRAGVRSLKHIGAEFGVSDAGIIKRAKRDGWTRDLKAKIKAKAEAKVSEALVSAGLVSEGEPATASALTKLKGLKELKEQAIVDGYAQVQADAILRHKSSIARAWRVVDMLFAELEHQTENADIYKELGDLMLSPDDKGVDRLNEIYRKAMSLPSRSGTVKTLLEALKTAIGLEREALNITDRTPGSDEDPIKRLVSALQGTALKPVTTLDGEFERDVG